MIAHNAMVTVHRPIYQRIGRREPARPLQEFLTDQMSYSPAEADRIWRLVRQCAEGCNQVVASEA
jgi:hypothetical protein